MREQVSHKLPIPAPFYHDLESVIETSRFWEQDNVDTELRNSRAYGSGYFQTDASRKLQDTLQKYFSDVGAPVKIVVVTLDAEDLPPGRERRQSNEDPDTFVVSAAADLTKKQEMLLILYAVESTFDFDSKLTKPKKIANDISTTIRHELVHDEQYNKVASRMGISKANAKQKFIDWGLIPGHDSPRSAYLGSHIELDAFGHEFAERMAAELGVERSLKYLNTFSSGGAFKFDPHVNFGSNFEEFFNENPESDFTAKLIKKIRKYLLRFKHHEIYESRRQKIMKITKKKLQRVINEAFSRKDLYMNFGQEPDIGGGFNAFLDTLENEVLGELYPGGTEAAFELYTSWKNGDISWDDVADQAGNQAFNSYG